jgi:ABC-type glycerol-3-phosphate transport system substrate-binding protein
MRGLIAGVAVGLAILTAVAVVLRPKAPPPGVIPLVWASGGNPFRAAQIARFNALHPELRLTHDNNNNRFETIIVQSSSGVGPDLYDALTGSILQLFAETGVAWDITPVAAANGLAADVDVWPSLHNEITYEGKQYGYPANVGCFVVLYNKNIFDRFGVPYPSESMTWAEFFRLLQRVSGTPPGGGERVWGTNALAEYSNAPEALFWRMVFYSRHGEFFSPDRTHPTIDTEDMRIAFQMHHDAIYKYGVLATAVDVGAMSGQGGWGGKNITQFADGHFATIISVKSALATLASFVDQQKQELAGWEHDPARRRREPRPEVMRLGVFRVPLYPGFRPCAIAVAQTVLINPASPHREQALAFLRFLASDTYAKTLEPYGLPANPRQATADYPATHPDLDENEITRCVIETMRIGYQTRKSPFLLDFDVERVLNQECARMESDPKLAPADLVAEAQQELDGLVRLNLAHSSRLAALYRDRTHAPLVRNTR